MKRVLVTGGAGYVGSALIHRLVTLKVAVESLDDLSTGDLNNLPGSVPNHEIDIGAPIPNAPQPPFDTIFHLAALSRIAMCRSSPDRTRSVNQVGTTRILALADRWKSKVVFASSCCAAAPDFNAYGHSKYVGEVLCESYRQFDGVQVNIARLFNVYGPGEPDTGPTATVVAKFAKAARERRPLPVKGDGSQRRDFVHIDDVVDALILLAEAPQQTHPIDVGTGVSHSILDLVGLFDRPSALVGAPESDEMLEARADPTAIKALGWEPKHRLEDYIRSLK